MSKFSAAVAILLAAVGCSKMDADLTPPQIGGRDVTVKAVMNGGLTRSSITEEDGADHSQKTWTVEWNKGDMVGGWVSGANAFSPFTMETMTCGKTATFTGNVGSGDLYLVYPCDETANSIGSGGKYTLDISCQRTDMDTPYYYTREKMFMLSDVVNEHNPTVTMHHMNALMEVRLRFASLQEGSKLLRIELEGDGVSDNTTLFPATAKADLTKATTEVGFLSDQASGKVSVSVTNSPELVNSAGETDYLAVQMAILPFTFTNNTNIRVTVYFEKSDGKRYKKECVATNGTGINLDYTRGTHNWLTVDVDINGAVEYVEWMGAGTEKDPWLIQTANDLQQLAKKVSDVSAPLTYQGNYFKMIGDIDLSSVCGSAAGSWNPIGSIDESGNTPLIYYFNGNFNGDGHKIKGLYIDDINANYQGLFGAVGAFGSISNLSVSGSVSGKAMVGGIVGSLGEYESSVKASVINSSFSGSVSAVVQMIGGIVGFATCAIIENCQTRGSITGLIYVGGLCGVFTSGTITNCSNFSSVKAINGDSYVGGIAGSLKLGVIINCYNAGAVDGNNIVGGIIGSSDANSEIANCYNTAVVTGNSKTGGIAGDLFFVTVANCYTAGEQGVRAIGSKRNEDVVKNTYYWSATDATGANGDIGITLEKLNNSSVISSDIYFYNVLNTNAKEYNEGANNATKPAACGWVGSTGLLSTLLIGSEPNGVISENWINHASPNFGGGLGTEASPYLITTPYEFAHLADMTNSKGGANWSKNKHFRLTNNIDLSGKEWTPIGVYNVDNTTAFQGTFDGVNYKITGLYINRSTTSSGDNYTGLFGYGSDNRILNLTINGLVKGNDYVGGVVGDTRGVVANCSFSGSVTGNSYVGGVCGSGYYMYNSYNSGSVKGTTSVGGVLGYIGDGRMIANCYNVGPVSGSGSSTGGIVGTINSEQLSSLNYYSNSCGATGAGKAMAEVDMKHPDFSILLNNIANKLNIDNPTWSFNLCGWSAQSGATPILTHNKAPKVGELYWINYAATGFASGDGSQTNPFKIATPEQLAFLSKQLKESKDKYEGKYFELTSNIDLTGKEWTPIGWYNGSGPDRNFAFNGIFDGKGHKIIGLSINQPTKLNQGLFGYMADNKQSNPKVVIKNIDVTGDVVAEASSAGIVGTNDNGVVDNCIFRGSVKATSSYIAGVASSSNLTINCTNYAEVTMTGYQSENIGGIVAQGYIVDNCVNYGKITGVMCVGGIKGEITGGLIINCTNYGDITANRKFAGGIVGRACRSSNIINSANYGKINCRDYTAGVCGIFYLGFNSKDENSLQGCFNVGATIGTNATGSVLGYYEKMFDTNDGRKDLVIKNNYYLIGSATSEAGTLLRKGVGQRDEYQGVNSSSINIVDPDDIAGNTTAKDSAQMQSIGFTTELNSFVTIFNNTNPLRKARAWEVSVSGDASFPYPKLVSGAVAP